MSNLVRPSKDERRAAWYLSKVPIFGGVGVESLRALAAVVEIREYRRRQIVYLPGDQGEGVFFIQGGRVRSSKVWRDGRALTLAYHGPGDFFGEMCVLEENLYEEMTEAVKNAIIVVLPRENFLEILTGDPALGLRFARVLGDRRRNMEMKLKQLVFCNVHTNLARLLLDLGREYGTETEGGVMIALRITHQEMANLIGSTRETISLALTAFKNRNLVHLSGRSIVLVDQDGLKAACP